MEEASTERENKGQLLGASANDGEGVDEEPARTHKAAPRPIAPTKAEVDAHEPLHLDYRSWCDHCVFGRGHSNHHRGSDDKTATATWHMDYAFWVTSVK